MFSGEYVHPLDEKNRVVFPVRLREALLVEKLNQGFYLTRGFDGSLLLFPKEEWDAMSLLVSNLPSSREEARKFQRLFFSKAVHLTLDRQMRILIPESHRAMAGIQAEVVFVGVGRRIEIWPKEKYGEYDQASSASYEELAEKVFYTQDLKAAAPPPRGGMEEHGGSHL
ncbi:MAG: division/cell wall cluster transcriptional repressor MraZ [Planctomycetes bacterium]|nr:division/cell wall cluster transcriptional repressor MraZ [Planctomycetota bacterium]